MDIRLENGKILTKPGEVDDFNRTEVKKWRIKEEWFFDKHRSSMDVRIIGMCPIQTKNCRFNSEGNTIILDLLPRVERFICSDKSKRILLKNNAQQRSYLGILEKRMFASR